MVDTLSLVYRCPSRQAIDLADRLGLDGFSDEADFGELKRSQWGDLSLPVYSSRLVGDRGSSIEAWSGITDELGWVGVQRRDNTWTVKAERSLPKWLHGDNCRILTAAEAQDAIYAYDAAIRSAAPFVDADTARITRLDVCWQQHVGDTVGAISALYGAIEPRHQKTCERYDTSLTFKGKQRVFRIYDKGAESKNPDYEGVLRMEEQLRQGVTLEKCATGLNVNREQCLATLNQRVRAFGDAVLGALPRRRLMQEQKWAVLYLAEHPEMESVYRETVSRQGADKILREVRSVRAGAVCHRLQPPSDAWLAEAMQ